MEATSQKGKFHISLGELVSFFELKEIIDVDMLAVMF